ncbi:hypothetical protein [Mucilaginibacter sp. OK268]|uniref:hypothetical protein n=1 Tax=Mucilaginibacter sp. OK268 TaxID=1881048 RepID=UPI0015A32817|nr:hypothetical protein [Mucilaginibacter sp. OK268]
MQLYHATKEANQPSLASRLSVSIWLSAQTEHRYSPDGGKGIVEINIAETV